MKRFAFCRLALLPALLAGLPACRTLPPPAAPPPPAPAAAAAEEEDEAYRQIRLLTIAMMQVRKGYVDAAKTDYKSLVYGAMRGMLGSLDPHSQFLEPQAYQQVKDDTQGEFSGIGIVIGTRDGTLTVIAPIEDTPAFKAGVRAGDRIAAIDGDATENLGINDAVKKLRGAKGTPVTLKLLRPGEPEPRTVRLVRDTVRVSSVKGARLLEDGIGYARITQFTETTAADLRNTLDTLTASGLNALVLDLRNNPGGLLAAAVEVSELFLEKGQVIVATRGRDGARQPPPIRAASPRPFTGFPVAILINGGSASASEIVAGALQDHKRAVLIGETSFGKASVQSLFPLDDQSAIRLTTAHYYTPSGRLIHEVGIQPDLVAPLPAEVWHQVQVKRLEAETPGSVEPRLLEGTESARDEPLERAVDLLKGLRVFEGRAR